MKESVAEKLWPVIEFLFQKEKGKVGRPEHDPFLTFKGILYILENSSKWRFLPSEYGNPSAVQGIFMKFIRNGPMDNVFSYIRSIYQDQTYAFPAWLAIDTCSAKAPLALFSGKNSTDRGKRGIKKSIAVDSRGAPIVLQIGPAHRHDSKFFAPMFDEINAYFSSALTIVTADSAYNSATLRKQAFKNNIALHAATNRRRNKGIPIIRPKNRWRVEPTQSWLNNFRSVKTCFAKTEAAALAFLQLAASIQLFRML